MNIAAISGTLVQNAQARGQKARVLTFTVETRNSNGEDEKNGSSWVPVVMFNPPPEIEEELTQKGKGLRVELQGRVNTSKFESNGETKYVTEVVCYTKSLHILRG